MARLDVAFVIGHDAHAPGTRGHGPGEHFLGRAFAGDFRRAFKAEGLRCRLIYRREGLGLADQYTDLIARLVALDPRCGLDLHQNGGGYPGSRTIHGGPGAGLGAARLADATATAFATAQGTADKGGYAQLGADGRPRAWTGHETESADGKWYPAGNVLQLLELPMPFVVLEPFDCTDRADYDAGLAALLSGESPRALARAVAAFLS